MLKTKCGCKKIFRDYLAPSVHNTITVALVPDFKTWNPLDEVKYRTFKFKEVNKKNVSIYEEI